MVHLDNCNSLRCCPYLALLHDRQTCQLGFGWYSIGLVDRADRADNAAEYAVQQLHHEKFSQMRVPFVTIFAKTYRRITETGNLYHPEP